LIAYDGSLIVVSHDRDFLQGLTERTIEFRDRKLHEYLGDVQYFLEKRQVDNFRDVSLGKNANNTNKSQTITPKNNVTELTPEQKKERHNRKKQLQRDLHNAERKVEKLEKQIVEYEAKMPTKKHKMTLRKQWSIGKPFKKNSTVYKIFIPIAIGTAIQHEQKDCHKNFFTQAKIEYSSYLCHCHQAIYINTPNPNEKKLSCIIY